MKFKDEFRQAIVEETIKEVKESEIVKDFNPDYRCLTFYIDENCQVVQELSIGYDLFSAEQNAISKAKYFKEKGYDYLIYINDQPFDEKGFFVEEE